MVTQIGDKQFPADGSFDEMQTIELSLDLSKGITILSTECCSSSHREQNSPSSISLGKSHSLLASAHPGLPRRAPQSPVPAETRLPPKASPPSPSPDRSTASSPAQR